MTDIGKVRTALQLPKEIEPQLKLWIDMAEGYIRRAGVDESVIGTDETLAAVCKGVFDIWTAERFSSMFHEIVTQLALSHPSIKNPSDDGDSSAGCDCETATNDQIDDLFEEDTDNV